MRLRHAASALVLLTAPLAVVGAAPPAGAATVPAPITTFADPGATIEDLSSITAGPDGRLWFTDPDTDRIARITPAGVITTFADPAGTSSTNEPADIVAGADGNLWYTSPGSNRIGRITPAGVITTFRRPGGDRLHQRARRDHLRTGRQHLVHEQR